MTQSELSALIMNQCSRYGEPSTLRALIPFLLTAAPEAVPFVEAAAEARDEFYRANRIRPWAEAKMKKTLLAGIAALSVLCATSLAQAQDSKLVAPQVDDAKIRLYCKGTAKVFISDALEAATPGARAAYVPSCIAGAKLRFEVDPTAALQFQNTPLPDVFFE